MDRKQWCLFVTTILWLTIIDGTSAVRVNKKKGERKY